MAQRIEDYALIGDMETAALVATSGSIDWLCLPRFDSGACFAALLGGEQNGHWMLAPQGGGRAVARRYRPGTLVLETEFETDGGVVRVIDYMPPRRGHPVVDRVVECLRGRVPMQSRLVPRFGYGRRVPRVLQTPDAAVAMAGPDALVIRAPVELRDEQESIVSQFTVSAGERIPFRLVSYPSHETTPQAADALEELAETDRWWRAWSERCTYAGQNKKALVRSLITLKALTYAPTGGIVAAPTSSLPEQIGGSRNWDYRYCWLRDASVTLSALVRTGYLEEATAWRDWLQRAVAGDPSEMQIMYGLSGEARLPEFELAWLRGYEGSAPVRIGNAASEQFQLDIYGEVIGSAYEAMRAGLEMNPDVFLVQDVVGIAERRWREPDEGIWEVRGPRRHFTFSKVMAWVAFDRAVKLAEKSNADAPTGRWRRIAEEIHKEVCERAFDSEANTFVQYYGSTGLDASLLLLPIVGFLPADDPRIQGTIAAIQEQLASGPVVARYSTDGSVDGLTGSEGAFLICSFWLVRALALSGRVDEARHNFEQLLTLRNDVGLLSEEYDAVDGRMLGNFPQALSHIGIVNSVLALSQEESP